LRAAWTLDDGTKVQCSLHAGSATVAAGVGSVHSFDGEGRWLGGVEGGQWWRRGLDGRGIGGVRGRLESAPASLNELATAHEPARTMLARALGDNAPRAVAAILKRALSLDSKALADDASRFGALYGGPVAVVPSDCPAAIYLQATCGCSWNRCTFCTLHAGKTFHVRSPGEFDRHVWDVVRWYGAGLERRRTAFLGDADALAAGPRALAAMLDVLDRHFERAPPHRDARAARAWQPHSRPGLWAVDAFASANSVAKASVEELAALRAKGMSRLYMGLETGDPELRKRLHRPESLATLSDAVDKAKAAGLNLALTVIAGLGGRTAAERHVLATAAFLRGLKLGDQDRVSVSPLHDPCGSGTGESLPSIDILQPAELQAQADAWRAATSRNGPRVAPYDLQTFLA
jgi:hypothetical protein